MNSHVPIRQEHHAWLSSEIERIGTMLAPASQEAIADRIGILFAALPAQDKGDDGALRARAYLFALDGVSLSALDGVTRDVLKGAIPSLNPTFAPTPPELSRLCRDRDAGLRAERLKREEDLERERNPQREPTVDECQRIAAKAAAASRIIGQTVAHADMAKIVGPAPPPRREHDKAREARDLAAQLVPMTDAEIEALKAGALAPYPGRSACP